MVVDYKQLKVPCVEKRGRGRPRKPNTPLREYWRKMNNKRKERARKKAEKR